MKSLLLRNFSALLTLCLLSLSLEAFAQQHVSGKVTDKATGEPLVGVSVAVKGTTKGAVSYYAIVLGVCVIAVAGYCLAIVLKPLIKIFERPEARGKEVSRKDHPELFSLIDEVVMKADCLQPKHVRISNECNAYVYYPSLLGYIFTGRQNLTIGLPLLYGLNKTELKAVLAHEFGHFTQKSVSMNRVANLSEFICASIARAQDEIDQEDDESRM